MESDWIVDGCWLSHAYIALAINFMMGCVLILCVAVLCSPCDYRYETDVGGRPIMCADDRAANF